MDRSGTVASDADILTARAKVICAASGALAIHKSPRAATEANKCFTGLLSHPGDVWKDDAYCGAICVPISKNKGLQFPVSLSVNTTDGLNLNFDLLDFEMQDFRNILGINDLF